MGKTTMSSFQTVTHQMNEYTVSKYLFASTNANI